MRRETKYARSDGLSIAYQVVGHGDLDLVFVMGWVSNIDYYWMEPHFARFLERLASFSRLILFDKRGTGLSDRPGVLPTLEERMDDVRAVMDAAGSERAVLFGISEGGPMCALFAATYPERTATLVIDGGYARALWAPDYPWWQTVEQRNRYLAYLEQNWGTDVLLDIRAPSLAHDEQFREWWSAFLRVSASPGAALALSNMNGTIDVRHVLPTIYVPTLVLHRAGDKVVTVEEGRYLAEHIPGARYVQMAGNDHLPFAGDQDAVLAEIEQFITGAPAVKEPHGVLATILVAEIMGAMAWPRERVTASISGSCRRTTARCALSSSGFEGARCGEPPPALLPCSMAQPGRSAAPRQSWNRLAVSEFRSVLASTSASASL